MVGILCLFVAFFYFAVLGAFAQDAKFYGHQNVKKIAIFMYEIIMHKLSYQALTKALPKSVNSLKLFVLEGSLCQLF